MTVKEKANDLLDDYWLMDKVEPMLSKEQSIQCALIMIEEIISALNFHQWQNKSQIDYYTEVKQEIKKL